MARTLVMPARVALRGQCLEYTLHRVAGRRHVHLVVGEAGEVQVRGPYRCSRREAEALLAEHADWVLESVRVARAASQRRLVLESGATLPVLDSRLRLEVREAARARVVRRGEVLEVATGPGRPDAVRGLLERWYRRLARRYFPRRLDLLGGPLGVRAERVTIRGQRTLWGSCTSRGTISLNWKLLLLASRLSDYVLVHELCHLRHMDHSQRFWALVAAAVPDHRERRLALERAQDTLAF